MTRAAVGLVLLGLGPALLASPAPVRTASAPAGRGELKGLWVVRTALLSPASVDQVVDDAARAGFTALFVQVRGRGDAFYDSRLVVRSPLLENQPARFDPLQRLLARARTRGLEVHAWINVLLTAHFGQPLPEGHVLRAHPGWVMVPRSAADAARTARPQDLLRLVRQAARGDPDVEGYYLSPFAPGAGEHLEGVVRELLRHYPVAGLHLDFIRYPGPDYDYSRPAVEAFRRAGGGPLAPGSPRPNERFDAFRREAVTTLARRLAGAARATRPGLLVSAAVAPDEAHAVNHRFQEWPRWLALGLLDAVCPMAYTPDSRLFRAQIENAVALTPRGGRVWAGVGAYRLSLDGTMEMIRIAREVGASGVLVFSHESLGRGDHDRLRAGVFARGGSAAPAGDPAGQ
jgi:uncharacterized lipoprotein YddW (UPF0748 family)